MDGRVTAFLDDLAAWAREQVDIRAVVLLGSQAQVESRADRFSDVDVALFADDPAAYLHDTAWLARFGEPLLTFLEPTAVGGFTERRVLFRDGLEVDFSIPPAAVAEAMPPDVAPVFARGFRVLYDHGLRVRPPELAEPAPPTQAQLDQLANDFWYHLLWAAKKLARGEVLLAKQVCDCFLTARLAELARWRAHGADTWHGLRFFERWAGEELVEALPPTFARYDAEDIRRALLTTAELFARLEEDVAERFGLEPPVDHAAVLGRLELLTPRPPGDPFGRRGSGLGRVLGRLRRPRKRRVLVRDDCHPPNEPEEERLGEPGYEGEQRHRSPRRALRCVCSENGGSTWGADHPQ